jgi:hypothetical protein
VGQGGCVPWHPDPNLDCYCLCYIAVHTLFLWVQMHVWWSAHSVCQVINLMVIQIRSARGLYIWSL